MDLIAPRPLLCCGILSLCLIGLAHAQVGIDPSTGDPFARLQFIHNVPDQDRFDVYLDDVLWLDDFAFRIDISWPIFLIAGLTALGVAFLTVSYQSIRAAVANPAKSLRYE